MASSRAAYHARAMIRSWRTPAPVDAVEKHLEARPVVQVFAWMHLVAHVHPGLVEDVEDRLPAPGELVESGLHEPRRALRPRIDEWPH